MKRGVYSKQGARGSALFAGAAFAQKRFDARRIFEPRIELEVELRRVTEPQRPSDVAADEALGALEALDRVGRVRRSLEMGKEDAPLTQIIAHPDRSQGHAAQARIAEIAQQ